MEATCELTSSGTVPSAEVFVSTSFYTKAGLVRNASTSIQVTNIFSDFSNGFSIPSKVSFHLVSNVLSAC